MPGGLSPCSQDEKDEVLLEGAPIFHGIKDEIVKCDTQEQDVLVYYASFPEDNSLYVTQAKFTESPSNDLHLACFVSGMSYEDDWDLDALNSPDC